MDEDEFPASERRWKPSMRRWVSAWGVIVGALLLGVVLAPGPGLQAAEVPARIPPDQAPARVNVVAVQVSKPAESPTAGTDKPVPRRVPADEVPSQVNVVEQVKVVTVANPPVAAGVRSQATITYRYGFYWFQYSATTVAVAGFAQTTTDFCAQRLFARARLYRDVQHTGNWEFLEAKQSEVTGACVVDSGEAKTGFWTAPNGTDWMDRTEHLASWNGNTETWNGQKVDSFP